MSRLEETYRELQELKKEKRDLDKMFKDELKQNQGYQEVVEELKVLREKKKGIENNMKANAMKDAQRIDELKLEISSMKELLSDLALNMYVDEQTVEIVDETDQRWVPYFSVTFKKD